MNVVYGRLCMLESMGSGYDDKTDYQERIR